MSRFGQSAVGRFLRGFGRFWYDFVVGDDPKIAAGAGTVLVFGALLVAGGRSGGAVVVLLAVLIGVAFTVSMLVDVARHRDG